MTLTRKHRHRQRASGRPTQTSQRSRLPVRFDRLVIEAQSAMHQIGFASEKYGYFGANEASQSPWHQVMSCGSSPPDREDCGRLQVYRRINVSLLYCSHALLKTPPLSVPSSCHHPPEGGEKPKGDEAEPEEQAPVAITTPTADAKKSRRFNLFKRRSLSNAEVGQSNCTSK